MTDDLIFKRYSKGLINLIVLNLSNNQIKSIEDDSFNGLENLEELDKKSR